MASMNPYKESDLPRTSTLAIVDAFREYGWETPDRDWIVVAGKLGPAYELCDKKANPTTRKASLILAQCKRAYYSGARSPKQHQPAITDKAREYARQHR
jgi:hypothetical protein